MNINYSFYNCLIKANFVRVPAPSFHRIKKLAQNWHSAGSSGAFSAFTANSYSLFSFQCPFNHSIALTKLVCIWHSIGSPAGACPVIVRSLQIAYGHGMRVKRLVSAREAVERLLGRYPHKARLARLWQNWSMAMGPELAPLAWPLGERKGVLLIGGEDAMIMQELAMMRDEILERANAFMDERFFTDVHVSLSLGKRPLDCLTPPPSRGREPKVLPKLDGSALRAADPDSPAARCYAAFLALARGGRRE